MGKNTKNIKQFEKELTKQIDINKEIWLFLRVDSRLNFVYPKITDRTRYPK